MFTSNRLTRLMAKSLARLRAGRHRGLLRVPVGKLERDLPAVPVESVIIPVIGAAYIEEGLLAATFAERFCPEVREIVIATNLPANVFPTLTEKVRVCQLDVEVLMPRTHAYSEIFRSRLIKILGPLQARFDRIIMIDSDMMLLKPVRFPFVDNHVMGCFRRGKMVSKIYRSGIGEVPDIARGTYRPYLWDHLNSAFLAAPRSTWERFSPGWLATYLSIWSQLPDNQPPTDQLPLCIALDHLDMTTVDLGDWVNWPVAKKIGGRPARIPAEVIGAHGGFPLSEWQAYIGNPARELRFISPEEMRNMRYLNDAERGS